VIRFGDVVGVLLEDMPCTRGVLCDDRWVDRCPVGGDLDRSRTMSQCAGEERPCRSGIAVFADQDVDDLGVLIDRPVQVGPAPGDLDVSVGSGRGAVSAFRLIRFLGPPAEPVMWNST
jgi:hypothetical protein